VAQDPVNKIRNVDGEGPKAEKMTHTIV